MLLPRFFRPVDIASVVYFRIAFGILMLGEAWVYLKGGRIPLHYVKPDFHFTYYGFHWVHPWPGDGMYLHFAALGLLALGIAVGLFYRVCTALFALGFAYVFLLDQSQYLNHFYLIAIVSFLMIFIPAHRAFSLDALFHRPIRRPWAPAWALWLLRFQIAVPYFFGGIAKINGDWLHGWPLREWLWERRDLPAIGRVLEEEWAALPFSYGGLLLDLFIVPFLLWKRTRVFAFCVALFFHLTNATLFKIGVFPWFMIAATLMFFPPSFPRAWLRFLGWRAVSSPPPFPEESLAPDPRKIWICLGLTAHVAFQCLFPLRHFLYPGDVNWTEEGHRFSWHMKLRDKGAQTHFTAVDPASGQQWKIDPFAHLMERQADKMSTRPDMILQFARFIEGKLKRKGHRDVVVYAHALVSLNGRKPQLLVDPQVDLTTVERNLKPAAWIFPLATPPPKNRESAFRFATQTPDFDL